MGTVIEFPKVRSASARSIDLDEFCKFGEVVLFTGVRYSPLQQNSGAPIDEDCTCCDDEQKPTALMPDYSATEGG